MLKALVVALSFVSVSLQTQASVLLPDMAAYKNLAGKLYPVAQLQVLDPVHEVRREFRYNGQQSGELDGLRWLQKAAELGDMEAEFTLANLYQRGDGVKPSLYLARKWYKRAAEQGHVKAKINLAHIYVSDQDEESFTKALNLYEQAAVAGDKTSMYHLGYMFLQGIGTDKNVEAALSWLKQAAQEKFLPAYHLLAIMFLSGEDVEKDYTYAAQLIKPLAERGDATSQYNLGVMFAKGLGVKKDYEKSIQWYRAAAENMHPEAMYNMSLHHFTLSGNNLDEDGRLALRYAYESAIAFLKAKKEDMAERAYFLMQVIDPMDMLTARLKTELTTGGVLKENIGRKPQIQIINDLNR